MRKRIAVIGGCGHVGLPLGVKLSLSGAETVLIDVNEEAVRSVNAGKFPFVEQGGDVQLRHALESGLRATTDRSKCANAEVIIFVTGTPVDEHLNPKLSDVLKVFEQYEEFFREGVLVIMRSTLFPGTMAHLHGRLGGQSVPVKFAFCPERVSQGFALDEIDSLPQVVSAFDEASFQAAYEVFAALAPEIIRLTPLEAELTKLMANSWRYLEFAIANQFYCIAESNGVDFYRLFHAIRYDYPRARGYKAPGFAAGPCLFKDTMQLASFYNNQFHLGHTAMLINEGLAPFVVDKTERHLGGSLWGKTVGLLGMAFKPENDDTRESLSFKVKRTLEFRGASVLWHDPYLEESTPLSDLLERSEAVVLATPHREYRQLTFRQPLIDVWDFYSRSQIEILPGRQAEKAVAQLKR